MVSHYFPALGQAVNLSLSVKNSVGLAPAGVLKVSLKAFLNELFSDLAKVSFGWKLEIIHRA